MPHKAAGGGLGVVQTRLFEGRLMVWTSVFRYAVPLIIPELRRQMLCTKSAPESRRCSSKPGPKGKPRMPENRARVCVCVCVREKQVACGILGVISI